MAAEQHHQSSYKPYTYTPKPRGKVWYTADLHIDDYGVVKRRGFFKSSNFTKNQVPDLDRHNAYLAEGWDLTVEENDTVFVLGDISRYGEQIALRWFDRRPGRKILVPGNHDPVHPRKEEFWKKMPEWLKIFDSIQPYMVRHLEYRDVLLSHFPYWSYGDGPDRDTARYEQFRLPDLGLPLLHGHTHGTETAHGNMFHVGVEAHDFWPVAEAEIIEWLKTQPEQEKFAPVVSKTAGKTFEPYNGYRAGGTSLDTKSPWKKAEFDKPKVN